MLIVIVLSLLLFGGYFEVTSTILFVGMSVYIIVDSYRNKRVYRLNMNGICILLIPLAYVASIPFAVDKGMALIGVVKFLPLIPLTLVISQLDREEKRDIIKILPICGVVMTILSVGATFFPQISYYLNVNNQVSGLFQYPNTFALFLVINIIIIFEDLGKTRKEWIKQGAQLLLFLYGIIESDSRMSLIVLAILFMVLFFRKREDRAEKKVERVAVLVVVGLGIVGGALLLATGSIGLLAESIDLNPSTFIVRILYWKDALLPILTHPLGLGYWGYLSIQGEIQTGMYSVVYVHNDFLQFFLDAGWIAGIALIVPIIRSIKSKSVSRLCKMILVFTSIFTMIDFHLQYISIFIIVLLCLDYEVRAKKKLELKINAIGKVGFGLAVVANLYFGVALGAKYLGANDLYLSMYPYDVVVLVEELGKAETVEESNKIADEILKINDKIPYAYGAKAELAYTERDFEAISLYKLDEIKRAPYNLEHYIELIDMMNVGMLMYEEIEDEASAEYCKMVIRQVPVMLAEVKEHTSSLAEMTNDKPNLDLPEEYIEYIENL